MHHTGYYHVITPAIHQVCPPDKLCFWWTKGQAQFNRGHILLTALPAKVTLHLHVLTAMFSLLVRY